MPRIESALEGSKKPRIEIGMKLGMTPESYRQAIEDMRDCCLTARLRHINIMGMIHHNPELSKFRDPHYTNACQAWNDLVNLQNAMDAELKALEEGGTDDDEEEVSGEAQAEEKVQG